MPSLMLFDRTTSIFVPSYAQLANFRTQFYNKIFFRRKRFRLLKNVHNNWNQKMCEFKKYLEIKRVKSDIQFTARFENPSHRQALKYDFCFMQKLIKYTMFPVQPKITSVRTTAFKYSEAALLYKMMSGIQIS